MAANLTYSSLMLTK